MTNADNASSEFNKHIKDVGKTVENAGGTSENLAGQASGYLKDASERASPMDGRSASGPFEQAASVSANRSSQRMGSEPFRWRSGSSSSSARMLRSGHRPTGE